MTEVIFFNNQEEFSSWLEKHATTSEVWVGYYKKSTGRSTFTWSTSVDVALCFGWIDGIRKTIDEQSYKIRFTPRKVTSVWSAVNVNKVKALIQLGKMKPAGMYLFNKRTNKVGYSSADRSVQLSRVYEDLIKANQMAWLFFTNLAPSYKRESIWWVMSAKKEETRLRRLGILIVSSEEGRKIPSLRKK
ncbi:bacteriocin-protection protein [Halobacteriovorax marinus]|mgnify:CR=1 FL=1|uniref:Bacteriocin-protection protein n=1 Tax=Halobacteriovorax marinus TaxID=97084 RepID=A0A1Y5F3L1_9BACT|nr:bacteriocin-protection protein [Halobacteriovorax marinus]